VSANEERRRFLAMAAAGAVALPVVGERSRAPGAGPAGAPGRAAGVFEVTRFGAVGDGRTVSTAALQKAIDACAAAGGGTVLLAPGRYISGALSLRSHVQFRLSAGARLTASQRPEDFPPIQGRDEGVERTVYSSLLTGVDLQDVTIDGPGILDGRGAPWWDAYDVTQKMRVAAQLPREAEHPAGAPLKWPRPRVINLVRCRDVTIEGITIEDPPFYAIHLVYCDNTVIEGLTTRQHGDSHSTGVVIDSSKHIRISGCLLSHGGDAIGIKSGYNEDGRRVGIAAEDILITNCHFANFGSTGVAIGSESAGGIRNVAIDNCVIQEGGNGIHIRAPRGRGGTVEQIRVSNVVMDGLKSAAIKISHFFDSVRMDAINAEAARRNLEVSRSRKAPVDEGTPTFRHMAFSGLTIGRVQELVLVEGLPERFIRGLVFQDISAAQASAGISCCMAAEVTISNLAVGALESAAVDAREVEHLEVHRLRSPHPYRQAPAIWLENVTGAFIHGCNIGEGGPGYQWLRQEQSRDITVMSNRIPASGGG
jgi:polygalacturonase